MKGATRGKIYVRGKRGSGGNVAARDRPEGTVSARVYRAATGEWEDHGIIGKVK